MFSEKKPRSLNKRRSRLGYRSTTRLLVSYGEMVMHWHISEYVMKLPTLPSLMSTSQLSRDCFRFGAAECGRCQAGRSYLDLIVTLRSGAPERNPDACDSRPQDSMHMPGLL